jgi:hypothetical protein
MFLKAEFALLFGASLLVRATEHLMVLDGMSYNVLFLSCSLAENPITGRTDRM